MRSGLALFIILNFFISSYSIDVKKPSVLVSILVRNKAHTLPYFLSTLEGLNYPKDRIALWIASDHNVDNSIEILRFWIDNVKDLYNSIQTEFEYEGETKYPDEEGIAHWTDDRFNHVMNLRESALDYGRKIWADYLLSLDADVFLTNPETLNYLVQKNYPIVAPMLKSEGLYSNFWHGMTKDYYYVRTEGYKPILHRKNVSCFEVPMVHSCVLVNLRSEQSDFLTYQPDKIPDFDGPNDDIIAFALGAKKRSIPIRVCNEHKFGLIMVPLEQNDEISYDYERLRNIQIEALNVGTALPVNPLFEDYITLPEKDTLGFDKIYMINLLRRPDRRERMHRCFDVLGLEVDTVDAVDGRTLNESFLDTISFMPDFVDPYHKRPMKLGEIGCFLSHHQIWQDIVNSGHESVLILEDDIRFEPFFRYKARNVMDELDQLVPDWDLVYFGRKILQDAYEPWLEGSKYLVKVGYSYWTLGYALSNRGAKKLLEADPLSQLVPVDEYLPILFDKHPQEKWKKYYPKRDLVAVSAAPLLVHPTHYTGDEGYISDTEDSSVIPETIVEKLKEDL